MAVILSIETATEVCSVALSDESGIVDYRESQGSNEHSALLAPFIDELMKSHSNVFSQLDAVAVSMGPGSYTGLRIGVSTAKGLCYALSKPLIAVSTLQAMAAHALMNEEFRTSLGPGTLLCPMIDARRMEVYCGLYDHSLQEVKPVDALIIDENSFRDILAPVAFFGNGAAKCAEILIKRAGSLFPSDIKASAIAVAMLANRKFREGDFVDTAYFEPFYLKDFIAAKPHVKGLR